MLNVFFTVDVEVWCDGWHDIDRKFAAAFREYVYGPTPRGEYALPHTLKVLNEHGLKGVFFVEPLFATRFGLPALAEIVGLLREANQHVELHLHTEWVDESVEPLLPDTSRKRQHLRDFSLAEQTVLIGAGRRLLAEAGGGDAIAFRAGNFGFNRDTLKALNANAMRFDSSYNATHFGPDSGVEPGVIVVDALTCDGVREVPMTVFVDGTGSLRHAQLTACSFSELQGLLWSALSEGRSSFVILSHNFELLNQARNREDRVVVERFHKLCAFLDRNRDSFRVDGFAGLPSRPAAMQPPPLRSPLWKTAVRMLEQAYRRRYA